MPGPRVSVVIPTHDRPRLLAQTLRSVLAQRTVDIEVIVVDDGSAPGTVSAVLPPDQRIRLVRHDAPRGVAEARNAGVAAASGEWVAFVDDDDLLAPDALAAQLAALAADRDCQWSYVGVVLVDVQLRIIGWARPPLDRDISAPMLAGDVLASASGVLAARALLDQAGPFDTRLSSAADWDLYLRLAQLSPLSSVDRPLLAYRLHDGAMTANVAASDREFELVCQRYRAERQARGIAIDRAGWEHWKEAAYLRRGQRRLSLVAAYDAARADHDWYRFARSTVVTVVPGAAGVRDGRQRRRVPPQWRDEATSWLAALRQPVGP